MLPQGRRAEEAPRTALSQRERVLANQPLVCCSRGLTAPPLQAQTPRSLVHRRLLLPARLLPMEDLARC